MLDGNDDGQGTTIQGLPWPDRRMAALASTFGLATRRQLCGEEMGSDGQAGLTSLARAVVYPRARSLAVPEPAGTRIG